MTNLGSIYYIIESKLENTDDCILMDELNMLYLDDKEMKSIDLDNDLIEYKEDRK